MKGWREGACVVILAVGSGGGELPSAGQVRPSVIGRGVISLEDSHESPAAIDPVTGDFYFSRASLDFSESRVLRVGADGRIPSRARFSNGRYDSGVALSPHDRSVVFTSKRDTRMAALPDGWNLWAAPSLDAAGATPLSAPVNTAASECCAAFAPDGSLLFSSDRDGSWDVFRARAEADGSYGVHRLQGSINSDHGEWPGHVSADGRTILISSIRPDGIGGDDIYVACREDNDEDSWAAFLLPEPINSSAYEDSPLFDPMRRALLWSSRRRPGPDSVADILTIELPLAELPECSTFGRASESGALGSAPSESR